MPLSILLRTFRRSVPPSEPADQPKHGVRADEKVFIASQWQLMWWKFRRHQLAMVAGVLVILLYLVALFAEPLSAYDPEMQDIRYSYIPPTVIHFIDEQGQFHLQPFVYGISQKRDLETLALVYAEDTSVAYPIQFFVKGDPYKIWGVFPGTFHLFGAQGEGRLHLFGGDAQGRDLFSRVIYGTRISMSVGLIGVLLSFFFGVVIGGISGYYGGAIDTIIQRVIEFLRSMPTVPLWMALSAALPPNWPPVQVYFAITIILSLIGWTGLARVVRGRFLALREEDFVMAAKISGSPEWRIIFRHMVPSFLSHIIAALTLAVPDMILSETALSFLGLGLRYPAISWGVLLQDSQNIRAVATAPWLLIPGLAVVLAVLSLNFLGDGLRDAADPYGK
jgi:peptide/nickel transport system permease protein